MPTQPSFTSRFLYTSNLFHHTYLLHLAQNNTQYGSPENLGNHLFNTNVGIGTIPQDNKLKSKWNKASLPRPHSRELGQTKLSLGFWYWMGKGVRFPIFYNNPGSKEREVWQRVQGGDRQTEPQPSSTRDSSSRTRREEYVASSHSNNTPVNRTSKEFRGIPCVVKQQTWPCRDINILDVG